MSASSVAPSAASTAAPQTRVRKPRWQAADTVVAVAVLLVAIIVGIFVLLCVQGYSSTLKNAEDRGQTAAHVVADSTSWVIASARAIIEGVEVTVGDDPAAATSATFAEFRDMSAAIPAEVALGVYDAQGRVISAASAPNAPRDISGTDYFEAMKRGAVWTLSAQEKDPLTDEATFNVVKRLGPASAPTGVLLVAIRASVLEGLAEAQQLGEGSTISIVRNDGWVIARHPSLFEPLNLAGSAAFENLNSAETGSYVSETSPADGLSRIVSFVHVDDLGLIAVASISRETVLAGLWSAIWIVSWLIAPIAVALLAGSIITARVMRRTQSTSQSLAEALQHNEMLFREIHHRVKNNLQSINSLVQLQPIPRDVKIDMNQRIAAMSAVHEHIYRSNTFSQVQVKEYLHKLIENIQAGYDPDVQVIETIEDVAVDKDSATPLGLIVNEVVSNAFKHAFKDGRQGTVTIALTAEGDNRATLTVRDNGIGFDPEAPAKGIGRRLIGGLTAQLQGESSHTSDAGGSLFTLRFPLARG